MNKGRLHTIAHLESIFHHHTQEQFQVMGYDKKCLLFDASEGLSTIKNMYFHEVKEMKDS